MLTVAFLDEGIRKLRAIRRRHQRSDASGKSAKLASSQVGSALATGQVLWRGMRAMDLTEEFLTRGGTELAPMSTTPDLSVAVHYGLSANTLLFRLTSTDFMDGGASIAYLSAFPTEDEMLYPPLTYLRPLGKRVCREGGRCRVYDHHGEAVVLIRMRTYMEGASSNKERAQARRTS